tara:strand:- start:82332 stop:83147 length:816 start_codon:yes stop_codon:yes gene_type:complete
MLETFDRPVILIGCGNMAGAMLARWLECGLDPARVTVVDPGRKDIAPGVTLLSALPADLPADAILLLGVKPQSLPDVAPVLAPLLDDGKTIISMLAGVSIETLRAALGEGAELVRIMPNMPVSLGKGVCALYADPTTTNSARGAAEQLLAPLGLVEWIADEGDFNLVTAVTGCGPAFVFRFIDALAQAARTLGMEEGQARRFAMATVQGAASLAAQADEPPATLADRVASKGGMTREGLDVLDADERLVALLSETLRAARNRGVELEKLSS